MAGGQKSEDRRHFLRRPTLLWTIAELFATMAEVILSGRGAFHIDRGTGEMNDVAGAAIRNFLMPLHTCSRQHGAARSSLVRFSRSSPPPDWPALALSAAIGATAGILVVGNFFTEGKKVRQLIKCPYGVGDDAFVRSMSHMLGPPLEDGNKVTALHNGNEIFPAMVDAIRGAQRSVCFENFVWAHGEIASGFAEALAERSRAGVKVHLLQDAMGCDDVRGPDMQFLKRAGVEVEIYRFMHLTRVNQRTHRKLLVIDGKVGFTGGVGISDKWSGNGDSPNHWRDSHFKLEGPAVAQMQQAFMDNWIQTHACVLHGDDYFPPLSKVGEEICQVFKSSADEGSDSARIMLLLSIAAARKKIRLANAYFIPDDLTVKTLVAALQRGVEVEVIAPGPLIDQASVRWISRSRWGPLLEYGARFFEFLPTNFHCKYLIVDECWCSVGSTNLDNRSLRLNEEANLNVLDKGFAAQMVATFESDKLASHEVTLEEWRQRPLSERAKGSAAALMRAQL